MNEADVTVLGRATSANVQKVMWLAGEVGLQTHRVDLGGPFAGNKDDAYLKLNPNGVVPTLIDGDTVVWESNSILRYLCNRFQLDGLYPPECARRSLVERWMDWQLTTLGPANTLLYQAIIRTPLEQQNEHEIEGYRLRNVSAFELLEGALDNAYLASNELTLADIAIGALAHRWLTLPVARPDTPRLRGWYERLRERQAFRDNVVGIPFS